MKLSSCLRQVAAGLLLGLASFTARAGSYHQDFQGHGVGARTFTDGAVLFTSTADDPAAQVEDGRLLELQLTQWEVSDARAAFLLPDLDPGQRISGFTASWVSPVYGNFPDGGAGFAFTFGPVRSLDLAANPGAGLEFGYGAGLTVSVHTGNGVTPGIRLFANDVKVAGPVVLNPAATWGNFSSTRHTFQVSWYTNTGLSVTMDGTPLFTNVEVPNFTPAAGDSFVWAARNGTLGETFRIDDIHVFTAMSGPLLQAASAINVPGQPRVEVAAQVNPNNVQTTVITELGTDTTYGLSITNVLNASEGFTSVFNTIPFRLERAATLHARVTASNALGAVTSGDMVFSSMLFEHRFASTNSSTQLGLPAVGGAVVWHDYNNDGWLDLTVAGRSSIGSSVGLTCRNPGTSPEGWSTFVAPSGYRDSVAVGDLDNDNRPDTFHANGIEGITFLTLIRSTSIYGYVSWAMFGGDSDSPSGRDRSVLTNLSLFNSTASIADLDRNGKQDVFLTGKLLTNDVRQFPEYADYSKTLENTYSEPRGSVSGFYFHNTALKEVDTDIPNPAGVPFETHDGQLTVQTGDLDGDGLEDVMVFSPSTHPDQDYIGIYINDGNMGHSLKHLYDANPDLASPGDDHSDRMAAASSALADFDGDGSLDLLLAYASRNYGPGSPRWTEKIDIWFNDSHGNFTKGNIDLPNLLMANVTVGDVFNHGRNDIVIAGEANHNYYGIGASLPWAERLYSILVLRNEGGGRFTPFNLGNFAGYNDMGTGIKLADYDNDGRLDIATSGLYQFPVELPPVPTIVSRDWEAGTLSILRNLLDIPANTPPAAPVNPATVVGPGIVTFRWDNATDDITPPSLLTYNLRVGTAPLGTDAVSPVADVVTGWRKMVGPGNCGSLTNVTYHLAPGTYYWSIQAVDGGFKGGAWATEGSFVVPELVSPRLEWQIGTDDNPLVLPYRPRAEFSQENNRNDVGPGKVTRLPEDPQYVAGSNPGADDDFYFAGDYPVGFNGLLNALSVPHDEPPIAWERAHTASDRTNRVHFVLTPAQVTAASSFQLSFELVHGGSLMGGVVQPGFGDHDLVVNFRNAAGDTTQLFSQRVSQATNLVIPFAASTVGAMAGANTLEIVRTGPAVSGVSYWIQYDYLRLESWPTGNTAPTLTQPLDRVVDEGVLLTFALSAVDADVPVQKLTYSRVSGPEGLKVSPTGQVTWTPTEAQGPGTYTVEVRVTDSGYPTQSDTRQFSVQVNEVADPVLRTVWQIGIDNNPAVSPYRPTAEFSQENNRNDLRPGKVTRLTGDPQYIAASNPAADDDFYFAGVYPPGFNGLVAPLSVPNDEPPSAWERAQTGNDRTNRMHFILGAGQVSAESRYRLRFELVFGGSSIGGVVQPGFGSHDMVVRFRNSTGASTELFAQRVTQATNVVIEFTAAAVGALEGANSIEIVRTGPVVAGTAYWINNDYFRLENLSAGPGPTGGLTLSRVDADQLAVDRDAAAVPGVARLGLVTQGGAEYLTLTYEEPYPAPSGVRFQVEGSSDLVRWSAEGITPVSDEVQSSTRTVTVRDAFPVGATPNRFLRVRQVAPDSE